MGAANNTIRPNIDQAQYKEQFVKVSKQCQKGPKQNRPCNDICCLVTFIILTLLLLVGGIFYIANGDLNNLSKMQNDISSVKSTSNSLDKLSNFNPSTSPTKWEKPKSGSTQTKTQNSSTGTVDSNPIKSSSNTQNQSADEPKHDSQEVSLQTKPQAQKVSPQISKTAGAPALNNQGDKTNTKTSNTNVFPDMKKALPWILLMAVFTLILCGVLIIAMSKIPKVIVYGMMVLTCLLIVGGIALGVVLSALPLVIVFGIFGFIWTLFAMIMCCCWRDQLEAAIILLKVTGTFLRNKPSVLLAPIFVMIFSFLFFAFWIVSFVFIQLSRPADTFAKMTQKQAYQFSSYDGASLIWLFLGIFFSYFFQYVMVFLVATATALWYFNITANYLVMGLKNIFRSHIGSLTFASMIVAVVSFLKSATQNNNDTDNGCAFVCQCIVRCCLSFIEELLRVLNNNSIIVMSFTGEGFIDSAKNALFLIFEQFGLFVSVQFVGAIINMSVFFLTIIFPTGMGYLLLKLTYDQSANDELIYLLVGTLIIFFVCLTISLLTITILSQALNCIFIFYCLNSQYKSMNYAAVNNVPSDMRELFSQMEQEGRQSMSHLNQGNNYNELPRNDHKYQPMQNNYNNNNQNGYYPYPNNGYQGNNQPYGRGGNPNMNNGGYNAYPSMNYDRYSGPKRQN